MSQGPGWWIASDDKWYPPESHPDVVASRAAAAEAKKTAEEKKTEAVVPEPGVLKSVVSPSSARSSTPSFPSPLSTTGPPPGAALMVTTRRRGWPWVLGLIVILGLAVAALVVALVSGSGPGAPASIGSSSGVSIHITVPGPEHPGFSGAVGAQDLTGKVIDGTSPVGGADSGAQALALPVFTYKGRFGGAPYVLHVSLDEAANAGQTQNDQFVFDVIGNYGSKLVAASATFNLTSLSGSSQTVSFHGHVGSQPINGVATATMEGGGGVTITGNVNAVPTA
jgi:hypothetical protein